MISVALILYTSILNLPTITPGFHGKLCANFRKTKAVNDKAHQADPQNNCDIAAFPYYAGFKFAAECLGNLKSFSRRYSGSVECFLILYCCNFATIPSASPRISRQNRKIISQTAMLFKDEFRSVSSGTWCNSS